LESGKCGGCRRDLETQGPRYDGCSQKALGTFAKIVVSFVNNRAPATNAVAPFDPIKWIASPSEVSGFGDHFLE
jgi:hypothetical protein